MIFECAKFYTLKLIRALPVVIEIGNSWRCLVFSIDKHVLSFVVINLSILVLAYDNNNYYHDNNKL